MQQNFFYMSPATSYDDNDDIYFSHFPCARALSMVDELSAARIVISLVKDTELSPSEQIVCARFLYEIAKNPDRQNALGKNLLLKEVEDLRNKIQALKASSKPDVARTLEDNLDRLQRKVHGILICYDRILENEDRAIREFSKASGEMMKANRLKWVIQNPVALVDLIGGLCWETTVLTRVVKATTIPTRRYLASHGHSVRYLTRMKTAAQLCNDEWESLAERDLSTYPNDLSVIVGQALASPRLRALFPFLSMGRLCLSQCTEYPFYVPLWFTPIGNGVFAVMRPEDPRGWVDGVEVQRGSATDVVHHAEQALARDECPVQLGNAETLRLG